MKPVIESVDAISKLEHLSGVKIRPGENPYDALIQICNDHPVGASVDALSLHARGKSCGCLKLYSPLRAQRPGRDTIVVCQSSTDTEPPTTTAVLVSRLQGTDCRPCIISARKTVGPAWIPRPTTLSCRLGKTTRAHFETGFPFANPSPEGGS